MRNHVWKGKSTYKRHNEGSVELMIKSKDQRSQRLKSVRPSGSAGISTSTLTRTTTASPLEVLLREHGDGANGTRVNGKTISEIEIKIIIKGKASGSKHDGPRPAGSEKQREERVSESYCTTKHRRDTVHDQRGDERCNSFLFFNHH